MDDKKLSYFADVVVDERSELIFMLIDKLPSVFC